MIATDIARAGPGQSLDGAVEYLLYRVIQRLEQQSHGNETLLKQVEQIAADITGNLPDLYLNGKFIYEDRLDEPGLRSAFLDRFGCTPHGFALQAKVDLAKLLLRETDLPLVDIAMTPGFRDQSHFNRVFKTATLMTPRGFVCAWLTCKSDGPFNQRPAAFNIFPSLAPRLPFRAGALPVHDRKE